MRKILIEKYVDGICVDKLKVPVAPLQFMANFLPKKACRELQRRGLDVQALLNDTAADAPAQWLDVDEGAVAKRVRLSLHD